MIKTEIIQSNHDSNVTPKTFLKKRALLLGLGSGNSLKPMLNYRPSPLLNLGDKSIIIHILEHLARDGFSNFDLILHHFPEQIEEKLGNGSRWGIHIHYHLAKNPEFPFSNVFPSIRDFDNELVLLGTTDSLPLITSFPQNQPVPIFYNYAPHDWSGWGLISMQDLKTIPSKISRESIPLFFSNRTTVEVSPYFSVGNYNELKESNIKFINKEKSTLLFPTEMKNIEPGVWISRSVILEPGVKINPPVLIGENTQIRSGATLGPNAIIENHCIIDNHSTIENSLVCQNSYVGENLELINCIVDRNTLINLSLNTQITLKEEFLISEVTPPSFRKISQELLERTFALILFIVLFPLYLLMKKLYSIHTEKKLRIPSQEVEETWTSFDLYSFNNVKHFTWLPTLINIIRGELSFVGSPPRSAEEVQSLPIEWRTLYQKTKAGMITLCDLTHGSQASEDEKYACETFYAVQGGFLFDLELFFRWVVQSNGI